MCDKHLGMLLILAFLPAMSGKAQDRMPPIPAEKMTELQKKTAAEYKQIRKTELAGGPFAVLLRDPDYVIPALEMRLHNLNNSALSRKLTELAILIAARSWTNNYEWNAHSTLAAQEKLSPAIVTAIAEGRRPEHMAEDEEILYDFCTELLHNQSVTDATYARALAKFGEPGVVEAASLEGYYTFLSMVMNTARTALPAGAKPALAPLPANQ
ncbi:MAG: carboxymuconolactone decarboxylase family protein [Acidobacteriia bacterium]|nr:carboxymuconolactone decarboxylase family protein [Terriglobia bacterium]